MNRTQSPGIQEITINIPRPETIRLDNGIALYEFAGQETEIVKIDLLFPEMYRLPFKPLMSSYSFLMMTEGIPGLTSKQIAEKFDYTGSRIQIDPMFDFTSITVYSLKKHLPTIIPLLAEIVNKPLYPEEDLRVLLNKNQQRYLVEQEKHRVVSRYIFNQALFGNHHPLGYYLQATDYDKLTREDLTKYHQEVITKTKPSILVSGDIDSTITGLINTSFGQDKKMDVEGNIIQQEISTTKEKRIYQEMADSVQSSIRMGMVSIGKNHPDYNKVYMLLFLLGGFFGSRLMKNIREEKGYTYGIYSDVLSLKDFGFIHIGTEVGTAVTQATIDEIYKEITLLQQEEASREELELMKNYLSGSLLRSFDGSLARSEAFKTLIAHGVTTDYYQQYMQDIQQINAGEMVEIAKKYLKIEEIKEIIVGKM